LGKFGHYYVLPLQIMHSRSAVQLATYDTCPLHLHGREYNEESLYAVLRLFLSQTNSAVPQPATLDPGRRFLAPLHYSAFPGALVTQARVHHPCPDHYVHLVVSALPMSLDLVHTMGVGLEEARGLNC
jgi:hypothetical protein